MAVQVQSQEEWEADVLQRFAENPENRDRALARCLWHLERLARIGSALETAMPQLNAVADNPLLKRMLGGNGR